MTDDLLVSHLRNRRTETPATAPDEAQIQADLTRGRRAVRRTRYRRGVAGLGVCAVAGVFATAALNNSTRDVPPTATPAISTSPTASPAGLRLVAYTGAQPEGFRLTTVPDGYRVLSSDAGTLVLGGPDDPGGRAGDFAGRVVIMLASRDAAPDHTGTPVTVSGHPAVIWQTDDHDGTRVLSYRDAQGKPVDIQVWRTITLSDADLVAMAAGITVTDDAVQGVG